MAAELRAEPCAAGIGPMTGEEGSGIGITTTGLGGSGNAVLQAVTKPAVALDTNATSQKRRGAAVKGSCLMVVVV